MNDKELVTAVKDAAGAGANVAVAAGDSGLGKGLLSLAMNGTAVIFVLACFGLDMFLIRPSERRQDYERHERGVQAMQQLGADLKTQIGIAVEAARLESARNREDDTNRFLALRDRDESRLSKLWAQQTLIKDAIIDLTMELRVYSGRAPERSLPKSAPKKMSD